MQGSFVRGDLVESDEGYQTCDLYLAAFFASAGCKMLDPVRDENSRRVYFVFEKNPLMYELKVKFFGRKAQVDAMTYADNIKGLKSLCHTVMNTSRGR